MRNLLRNGLKSLLTSLLVLFGAWDAFADRPPNVIYILADDLGYGDLGCYGSRLNSTPNIDQLASSGVRLTDFHAAAWCAPSRRALMTGRHANRPGAIGPMVTIAEMLSENGYETALLGKWHLGMNQGTHPLDQGFDYFYGTKGSNDWDGPRPNYDSFRNAAEHEWKTPLLKNREVLEQACPQSSFTNKYTQEAIRLIKESKDKPFFIYLAHNMPHVPVFASDRFKGQSDNGVYGDVLMELDWSTGEIVKTLKETGLYENTIVVFTSDNGPWTMFKEFGGIAKPLRGEKSTTWNGGEQVPCIFSWPNQMKPKVSNALMANYDVYATLARLTGSKIKEGQAIDSLDLSDVILSTTKNGPATSPRTQHLFFFRQAHAWRNGDYKIHFFTRERTRDPETGKAEPSIAQDPPLLFNVATDPGETTDIAAESPEIVERLTREYEQAKRDLKSDKPFFQAAAITSRSELPPLPTAADVDIPENIRFIVRDPKTLPGLVVDDTKAKLVGEWKHSVHTPPFVGSSYIHDLKEAKGEKSATFVPNLPLAGRYEIRISHNTNIRRANGVPVEIRHADGITKVFINEGEEAPIDKLFRSIGTFRFEKGEKGSVTILTKGTEGKYVIVDAVQFIPEPLF